MWDTLNKKSKSDLRNNTEKGQIRTRLKYQENKNYQLVNPLEKCKSDFKRMNLKIKMRTRL